MSDQPQHLQADANVFVCDNCSLAVALTALGCKHAEEGGKTMKGTNTYSFSFVESQAKPEIQFNSHIREGVEEILNGSKGHKHETGIVFLWKMGVPGKISYLFQRTEALKGICRGWDKQGDAETANMGDLPVEAEHAGIIIRKFLQTEMEYVGNKKRGIPALWRTRDEAGNLFIPAIKHVEGIASTSSDGHRRTSSTIIRNAKASAVAV